MNRRSSLLLLVLLAAGCVVMAQVAGESDARFRVVGPVQPDGAPTNLFLDSRYEKLTLVRENAAGAVDAGFSRVLPVRGLADGAGEAVEEVSFIEGVANLGGHHLTDEFAVRVGERWVPLADRHLGGWLALLPPLVAILLAILVKEVLVALFAGVLVGVCVIEGDLISGFFRTIDRHVIGVLGDEDRLKILVFSCLLGAVVALVARLGGIKAIVEAIARRGRNPRSAQLSTWLLGVLVFFDDYANALLVGNTMRPISDRLRVSREKLSFLVDATSAPVACVAVISTWIASEISYISGWLADYEGGVAGYSQSAAYQIFLDSIPYSFYPLLALAFGLMLVISRRDFGPMYHAELRARTTGKVLADDAVPLASRELEEARPVDPERLRWWNGALPIGVVVFGVLIGLWLDGTPKFEARLAELKAEEALMLAPQGTGGVDAPELRRLQAELQEIEESGWLGRLRMTFGAANSYNVLLWATLLGLVTSWVLALVQRLMNLRQLAETSVAGIKAMLTAALVLILAWTLADLCKTMNTSGYLIQQVSFSFNFLPVVVFLLSAVVGFSTGSSWGTMGILIPLTMTYATQLGVAEGADPDLLRSVLLGSLGGVLAGSVFGDHCSPISDTTVMSSMASGADHMHHVRTQLPYAMVIALVAALAGYLPAGFGVHPGLSLIVGLGLLLLVIRFAGRPLPAPQAGGGEESTAA